VHFLDPRRRDGRDVANHFKYLANTFPVTFIYVGVGLERRGLVSEGLAAGEEDLAQNARRWTTLGVSPFEIGTETGRRTWRQLLLAIEKDLVLAGSHPGMVADGLADYLFARSTGHFASLMTLITRGCRRAVRTGAEELTRDLLDQIRNAAAEAARQELLAAFDTGKLRARPAGPAARSTASETAARVSRKCDRPPVVIPPRLKTCGRPDGDRIVPCTCYGWPNGVTSPNGRRSDLAMGGPSWPAGPGRPIGWTAILRGQPIGHGRRPYPSVDAPENARSVRTHSGQGRVFT
jgi:hypothetical protein